MGSGRARWRSAVQGWRAGLLFLACLPAAAPGTPATRVDGPAAPPAANAAGADPAARIQGADPGRAAPHRLPLATVLLVLAWLVTGGALGIYVRRYRRAEHARRAGEARYARDVSVTADALWDWNLENGDVYYSTRWKEILGYAGYDDLGNNIETWKQRLHPEDRELVLAILGDCLDGRSPHFSSQHRLRTRRNDHVWVLERGRLTRDRQGKPLRLTVLVSDVTERKLDTELSERQVLYDPLTELPNRSLFRDRLEHALLGAARRADRLIVARLELSGFREPGTRRDGAAGDRVLREAAQRIRATLRQIDTVARLGNDEFALLLPDTDLAHAILPLHRILQALERPVVVDGRPLPLAAVMGVALHPDHGKDADTLLQCAHVALYTARHEHTGYAVYTPAARPDLAKPDRVRED